MPQPKPNKANCQRSDKHLLELCELVYRRLHIRDDRTTTRDVLDKVNALVQHRFGRQYWRRWTMQIARRSSQISRGIQVDAAEANSLKFTV